MNAILAGILSATMMGAFSTETQTNFMTSCAAGTDKAVCNCVLQKLEAKYSESEFRKMESQLVMGKEAPGYMDFVVNARLECNAAGNPAGSATGSLVAAAGAAQPKTSTQVAQAASQTKSAPAQAAPGKPSTEMVLSASDLMILQALLSNKTFKSNFVDECTDEADDVLGKKQSKKSCQCAYERLVKDETLLYKLMSATNVNGEVEDFEKWGYELISPCLPANFTPEMEKAFMKECTDDFKGNKKACQCAFGEVQKNYTVQTLLQAVFLNEKKFERDMLGVVGACAAK